MELNTNISGDNCFGRVTYIASSDYYYVSRFRYDPAGGPLIESHVTEERKHRAFERLYDWLETFV